MNIKEIEVSLSGVIPSGPYENLRPGYKMTIELNEGDNEKDAFKMANDYLHDMFELEVNRAKADLIDKQYENIRFYEKDGKKYPSVTSILGWNTNWKITEDELNQYASRGTIVHKLIELYLKTGKWEDPDKIEDIKEDVAVVCGGSLNLNWTDCSHEKFFEVNGKDIVIEKMEQEVINTEVGYGGRYDAVGTYKGKKALFDFKTGSTSDFRQLAAYAMMCDNSVDTLIIAPVGKTDNKSGFMRPKENNSIETEFKAFVKARMAFKRRFGI